MLKTTNVCNNCCKKGHLFHQCNLPIVSYGIIVFKKVENQIKYLMIRRKDSFGYIDFIRGNYSPYNTFQLQNIVNEMTNDEKNNIIANEFDFLWKKMWGETPRTQYKNEEQNSNKKYNLIKNGILINDTEILLLNNIVEKSNTNWVETEWEFPKGRKNYKEKDLECALREFEEETGISQYSISVIENILPFEEIFIGTNHKSYKHKYFLAYISNETETSLDNFQQSEVSKIEWKTVDECLESIRPYNLEKKNLIRNINKVLQEYRLYS